MTTSWYELRHHSSPRRRENAILEAPKIQAGDGDLWQERPPVNLQMSSPYYRSARSNMHWGAITYVQPPDQKAKARLHLQTGDLPVGALIFTGKGMQGIRNALMEGMHVTHLCVICHQPAQGVRVSLQGFCNQHGLVLIRQTPSQAISWRALCDAPEVQLQLGLKPRHACSIVAAQVSQLPVFCIVLQWNLRGNSQEVLQVLLSGVVCSCDTRAASKQLRFPSFHFPLRCCSMGPARQQPRVASANPSAVQNQRVRRG